MPAHPLEKYGLASETFTLKLDKLVQPGPVTSVVCKFSYVWDFPRNMGHAVLVSVDGIECNKTMFPLGLQGKLSFMNTDKTTVFIPGGSFVCFRVILNIVGEEKSAALMIGENGDEILGTQNWSDDGEDAKALARGGKN